MMFKDKQCSFNPPALAISLGFLCLVKVLTFLGGVLFRMRSVNPVRRDAYSLAS